MMRGRTRAALVLAMTACVPVAEARFDGWHCNTVSTNVVTPHFTWIAPDAPRTRALFFVSQPAARQVAEVAQRMPLDFEAIITPRVNDIGGKGIYESAMIGASPDEKKLECRRKVLQRYDVYVITSYDMSIFPPDATYRIFDAVENGAGLVVTGERLPPYKKLFVRRTLSSPGEDRYQFGEGRIVHFKFTDKAMRGVGELIQVPGARLDSRFVQENRYAAFIRGMRWAAGQETRPDGRCVKLRYRDEHNRDCGSERADLPAGVYAEDILSGDAFVTRCVTNRSAFGAASIVLQETAVDRGVPFKGELALERAHTEPLKVGIELIDFPYERIWQRFEAILPAGATNLPFSCATDVFPTRAGYVRLSLGGLARPKAFVEAQVLVRDRSLSDYLQLQWYYGPDDVNLTETFVDEAGFEFALGNSTSEALALRNLRIMSFFTALRLGATKSGNSQAFRGNVTAEMKAKYGGDVNFYNPLVQNHLDETIRKSVARNLPLGTVLYSLGDENQCSDDAATGPDDLKYFRQFLRRKYGDVEKLNRARGTTYASFDEVPHPAPDKALAQGDTVAWNDHVDYVETMFADLHGFYADRIHAVDPKALVGTEGIFGGCDIEGLMTRLDWLGPYFNGLENDVLRSLHPDAFRSVWSGYNDERGEGKLPVVSKFVNRGIVRGNAWFCAFGGSQSFFAYDYRFSFPKPFMDELQRLRFAQAPLLVSNRMMDFGIGVWWDHLSRRAHKADARLPFADESMGAILSSSMRTGFSAEYASARRLERLDGFKILFLSGVSVMSSASAAAIRDFVRKGGMLVADRDPAWFDECFHLRERSALDDVFGGLAFGATNAFSRSFGAGRVRYLGRSLGREEATEPKAFDSFLSGLYAEAGVRKQVAYEGPGEFRLRTGKDFTIASVFASASDVYAKSRGRLMLDSPKWVYRYGRGLVGRTASVDFAFGDGSIESFSLFDDEQKPPSFTFPRKVRRGETIRLNCEQVPAGRTTLVRVLDPDGHELKGRNLVFNSKKDEVKPFAFAFTDKLGDWTFEVIDVTTSLPTRQTVSVVER